MRLLLSFAALFLAVILQQLSSGGVAPLDALSAVKLEFSTLEIGMLGSAHFVGFFLGCWLAPRLLGSVGHARAFAAFTATGAIGLMAHMLVVDAYAWAAMRVMAGFCIAGSYTIIEAWLQAKVTNANRGRAMGVYRVVDTVGSLGAQLMIGVLEPASYVSYNILAIICCASLIPLVLTTLQQPATPEAPRLRPQLAWKLSPLAAIAVVVAALTASAFRMVGPVYGLQVGLNPGQIAWFLAVFIVGGALAQIPMGWLADKRDRRWVLIWLSVASIVAAAVTVLSADMGIWAVMLSAALFGFTTFPIYSVATAHANDFATSDQRVELAAALMFYYALGGIGAPFIASVLIDSYGPEALFALISLGHVGLVLFGLLRMRARPSPAERTNYVYAPRTSFVIGTLMGRFRDRQDPAEGPDDDPAKTR